MKKKLRLSAVLGNAPLQITDQSSLTKTWQQELSEYRQLGSVEEVKQQHQELKSYKQYGSIKEVARKVTKFSSLEDTVAEYSLYGTPDDVKRQQDTIDAYASLGPIECIRELDRLGISLVRRGKLDLRLLVAKGFLGKLVTLIRQHGKEFDVKLHVFKTLIERKNTFKNSAIRELKELSDNLPSESPSKKNVDKVIQELS